MYIYIYIYIYNIFIYIYIYIYTFWYSMTRPSHLVWSSWVESRHVSVSVRGKHKRKVIRERKHKCKRKRKRNRNRKRKRERKRKRNRITDINMSVIIPNGWKRMQNERTIICKCIRKRQHQRHRCCWSLCCRRIVLLLSIAFFDQCVVVMLVS